MLTFYLKQNHDLSHSRDQRSNMKRNKTTEASSFCKIFESTYMLELYYYSERGWWRPHSCIDAHFLSSLHSRASQNHQATGICGGRGWALRWVSRNALHTLLLCVGVGVGLKSTEPILSLWGKQLLRLNEEGELLWWWDSVTKWHYASFSSWYVNLSFHFLYRPHVM